MLTGWANVRWLNGVAADACLLRCVCFQGRGASRRMPVAVLHQRKRSLPLSTANAVAAADVPAACVRASTSGNKKHTHCYTK